MAVLVDTPIWSHAFRYPKQSGSEPVIREFSTLVQEHRADILGSIRQEILSGIKHITQFRTLRAYLRAFVDLPIETGDFEYAAELTTNVVLMGFRVHLPTSLFARYRFARTLRFSLRIAISYASPSISTSHYTNLGIFGRIRREQNFTRTDDLGPR